MPTNVEIKNALFVAVRKVLVEKPYVGVRDAKEWAVSGRIGIVLARDATVRKWEECADVRVDLEYAQMGLGLEKLALRDGPEAELRALRPDLLIHKRGDHSRNWLVCEVKMHDEKPSVVDPEDLGKLRALKWPPFKYRVAIWLSMPRSPDEPNAQAYFAVVRNPEDNPRVCLLKLRASRMDA